MRPLATVLAALALAAGAAAPAAAQKSPPTDAPDPSITDGSAQRALDRARERWRAEGLRSYRFRIRVLCFCPRTGARRITVVRRRPRNPPPHLERVATVPRMFRHVQAQIDAGVSALAVRYGKTGFPRSIAVDGRRSAADDEVTHTAWRLRPYRP